jgi:uroporphyrinogen-III synthase
LDAPAIQIVPLADQTPLRAALQNLSSYDWVIFTSANAVTVTWATAETTMPPPTWNAPQIAAVGEATARALAAHGLTVRAMPTHYLGSELVPVLGDLAGKRVLLPRSAQGRGEIVAALQRLGADVDDIPIYTPQPVALQEAAIAQLLQGVDVVTFASGSAVRAFAAAVAAVPGLAALWTRVTVACIGPSTAAVASELGLPVHITAQEHTAPGLVRALCQFVAQMSSPTETKPA